MSGIGIILNPHSRENLNRPDRADHLGFIVGDKGSCHATHSVEDVARLAHEFKERGIELLGISGGDGTNHVTLTTFIKTYEPQSLPKIAFLRGGTMNNLANAIGIRGTPEKILSNLIIKYHEDEPFQTVDVDILKVNGMYGFIFGTGAVSKFIDEYNNTEEKPSPMRGLKLLGKAVVSAVLNTSYAASLVERFDARVIIDGSPAPFKNYSIMLVGKLETLGFNFRPLYRARASAEEFQFLGVSATPRHILFTFPHALLARPPRSDNYYDAVGKHIVIEFDKPVPYMVDGDSQPPTNRVEITVGPRLTCIVS